MQDTTAPISPESSATAGLPDGPGHLATQLSAAAVGTFGASHYPASFARLAAAGRALASWNWAAALAGPAWLAFRALWQALAVYVVLALALISALVAAHVQALLPGAVLAGIALALWLGGAVVLGLWGDALVFNEVQRRIEAAVAQAATVQQATQQLQSTAPTRRRAVTIAACLIAACVGAAVLAWRWGGPGEAAPVADLQVVLPVTQAVPTEAVPPSQPVTPEVEQEPVPAQVPGFDENEAQAVQDETDAALAALQTQAVEAVTTEPAPSSGATPKRPAAEPSSHGKSAASAPPAAKVRKLYINVGVFADRANAARVQERLRKDGLPVRVSTVRSSSGKTLRRVRVGPFTSAAQANEAAAKVRLLGLDAVPASNE